MNSFSISLIAGVVAALITTLFLWSGRILWKSHLKPWYEDLLYRDARIDGRWEASMNGSLGDDYKEEISLEQTGHSVKGSIICIAGPNKGRKYEFEGSIRNSILSATYSTIERTALDSGSFTLQLIENGKKLKGTATYYFDKEHTLKNAEYVWIRKRENI